MGLGRPKAAPSNNNHPGWTWDSFRKCWSRGPDRVYPVEAEFVISSHGTWLPGSFPTFDDAVKGFGNAE